MTRVLQICGTAEGGSWFTSQVKELVKRGYVIEAVVPGEGPVAEAMRALDVPVHVIPFRGYRPRDFRRHVNAYRAMRALVRSGRFDVVHAHLLKSYFLARLITHRSKRMPGLVSQVPGNAHLEMPALRAVERLTVPLDGITAVSCSAFVNDFQDLGARVVEVVRYGLDTDAVDFNPDEQSCRAALGLAPGEIAIGMVAHMYPTRAKSFREVGVKGHETFIDAAAIAHRARGNLRFFVVGDEFVGTGSYKDALMRRAKNHEVKIEFLGHLSSMADFLPAMDILSNPSTSESASYTVIEAGLARRPVAATKVGGLTDSVIDGSTGLLVPVKDAHALAGAFIALADDPEMRERMGVQARRHVIKLFDISATTTDLERVYERLL
ncbi:hypothetical protein GCM10028802_23880 [Terrabacter terrigena]